MSPDGSVKPSPEERLLKLIRGKPTKLASGGPGGAAVGGAAYPARSLARRSGYHWPQIAIVGLSVLLGLEGVYLIVQLARPVPEIQAPPLPKRAMEQAGAGGPEASPSAELAEIPSLSTSASRPLFISTAEEPKPNAQAAEGRQAPSTAAKQLSTRLTLVGIIDGDPAQVILEDSQNQKTFFVTIGQATVEGAVLEQVQGNRVILDLQGEKIELSM